MRLTEGMSNSNPILKNVLLVVVYTTIYYVCASCGTSSQESTAPLKLEEVANPTDIEEPVNRVLFSDMYKSGVAVTQKQFVDRQKQLIESGQLSVGSQISPSFFIHNTGGAIKGLRITAGGSAVEQGMLIKPQLVVGSQTFEPLLAAIDKTLMHTKPQWKSPISSACRNRNSQSQINTGLLMLQKWSLDLTSKCISR